MWVYVGNVFTVKWYKLTLWQGDWQVQTDNKNRTNGRFNICVTPSPLPCIEISLTHSSKHEIPIFLSCHGRDRGKTSKRITNPLDFQKPWKDPKTFLNTEWQALHLPPPWGRPCLLFLIPWSFCLVLVFWYISCRKAFYFVF